jgi:hypothetical protein
MCPVKSVCSNGHKTGTYDLFSVFREPPRKHPRQPTVWWRRPSLQGWPPSSRRAASQGLAAFVVLDRSGIVWAARKQIWRVRARQMSGAHPTMNSPRPLAGLHRGLRPCGSARVGNDAWRVARYAAGKCGMPSMPRGRPSATARRAEAEDLSPMQWAWLDQGDAGPVAAKKGKGCPREGLPSRITTRGGRGTRALELPEGVRPYARSCAPKALHRRTATRCLSMLLTVRVPKN